MRPSKRSLALGAITGEFVINKFALLSDSYYIALTECLLTHNYISHSGWSDKGVSTAFKPFNIERNFSMCFSDKPGPIATMILWAAPAGNERKEGVSKFWKSMHRYDAMNASMKRVWADIGWNTYIEGVVNAHVVNFEKLRK